MGCGRVPWRDARVEPQVRRQPRCCEIASGRALLALTATAAASATAGRGGERLTAATAWAAAAGDTGASAGAVAAAGSSCGSSRWSGWRLDGRRLLGSARLCFADGSGRLGSRRLDHTVASGRRDGDGRTRCGAAPAGALATTGAGGRREAMAGGRRRDDNGRRLTRLGHNLARLRAGRRSGRRRRQRPRAAQACRGGAAAAAGGFARRMARAAPLLPLPASWPEWPSSHRRAWRCARDRSWA